MKWTNDRVDQLEADVSRISRRIDDLIDGIKCQIDHGFVPSFTSFVDSTLRMQVWNIKYKWNRQRVVEMCAHCFCEGAKGKCCVCGFSTETEF